MLCGCQVLLLSGSTLLAALSVLALKSLPQVERPVTSSMTKIKLKVCIVHNLLGQDTVP